MLRVSRAYTYPLFVLVALGTACNGVIGAADSTGAQPGVGPGQPSNGPGDPSLAEPSAWSPGSTAGDPNAAGYMPLRQLNRTEYRNALADLFGAAGNVAEFLPGDVAGSSGFATAGLASEVTVQALQKAAEQLAASADLALLTGCDPQAAAEEACLQSLLDGFAARAYRRPLNSAERADYSSLYSSKLRGELLLSVEAAVRVLIAAILQSPGFLYHWELGPVAPAKSADGLVKLSSHEVASRLSFLLWSSIPDPELLQAAAAGQLATPQEVQRQARRLLASSKSVATMRNFHLQWLGVDLSGVSKSAALYPSYNASLAAAMEDELAAFTDALFRGGGTVKDLFLSQQVFVEPGLAGLYGVEAGAGQGLLPRAAGSTRPGLLTRAGFLTATSNAYEGDPTKRGAVVRQRVLCGSLTPPPANVPALPPPDASLTVRERHALHMSVEPCKTCHELTDPIGFGFANFDAVGAYRAEEAGKPIDASGKLASLDGQDPTFSDVGGLMSALSESQDVRACLTRQWLRFGFAREESRADDHTLETAYQAFAASGYQLSELLVALTTTRSFLYRAPAVGEVTQ